jgi:hypothetical protein
VHMAQLDQPEGRLGRGRRSCSCLQRTPLGDLPPTFRQTAIQVPDRRGFAPSPRGRAAPSRTPGAGACPARHPANGEAVAGPSLRPRLGTGWERMVARGHRRPLTAGHGHGVWDRHRCRSGALL